MEATLLEDGGWWEKAEKQRNMCQMELVPVCVRGVEVCKKFGEGGGKGGIDASVAIEQ